MIEESVGIDRKAIKLFMKVLLIMKHHMCIVYGISQTSHRGIEDGMAGIGQGNISLGTICRDKSYFIIQDINKNKKVTIIKLPKSKSIMQ